jgi:hypothetical protein
MSLKKGVGLNVLKIEAKRKMMEDDDRLARKKMQKKSW